jgi:hypothetical protein
VQLIFESDEVTVLDPEVAKILIVNTGLTAKVAVTT